MREAVSAKDSLVAGIHRIGGERSPARAVTRDSASVRGHDPALEGAKMTPRLIPRLLSHRPTRLLVIGLVSLLPAVASAQAPRWTARVSAAWVSPTGDDLAGSLTGTGPFRFAVDDGPGLAAELEYRLTPRFGLELSALTADLDAELSIPGGATPISDVESSTFELYGLGLGYHPTHGRRTDFHVGLFAAIAYFDDVVFLTELDRPTKLVFDDDVGFGLELGVDHAFGSGRWRASAGLRYFQMILEGEQAGQDADLDPLILTVGVGYRF